MHVSKTKVSLLCLVAALGLVSCSAKTADQKEYGADTDYFIGLQYLEEGKIEDAASKFEKCAKKGSGYCARKSAEELCKIGDIQQKNSAVLFLVNSFRDSDSLLIAARQLSSSKEINKLIEITENLDFSKEKNETIKLRLEAMKTRCDSRFEEEVFQWFTSCPVSEQHLQFYRDTYNHPDFDNPEEVYTARDFVINYRVELYHRNYSYTLNNADIILNYMEKREIPELELLASDIGKSYLYASGQYVKNGQYFKTLAETWAGTKLEYYFWFYAGRFYNKAGNYFNSSKNCFTKAMACANTENQKDDALWYLLEISRNFSVDTLIANIGEYSRQWTKASNFESFFEGLITPLLASGKWEAFYNIYTAIDGYATDETVGQYAYIYGRLCQKGLAKGGTEKMESAFRRACNSGSSVYYKALATYQLKLTKDELSAIFGKTGIYKYESIDTDAEKLLKGYAAFGFPQYIYENYRNLYKKGISLETSLYLSDFLIKCATASNDYYPQSLRIASRASFYAERPLTKEELKLVYPQNYKEIIEENCAKYDFNPSVMYALVRSESFFDADVQSVAGANGLTQLMVPTADDIARRLKKSDYDIVDPATNVELGTWYLNNLYTRCNNSFLMAFFSYNGGITRVRKWLKGSMIEFGQKSAMPEDLFLETVPITETREYGRKLVSATVMYDYLYNNISFADSVQQVIK